MRHLDRMVARSKQFMTETEEDNYSSAGQAGGPASTQQVDKGGAKRKFNMKQIMMAMEEQRRKSSQIFFTKLLAWFVTFFWVLIGHFYAAMFIIWSASVLHKEVISTGHVLRKDSEIRYSWLDVYWYMVGAYIAIPYAFLRRSIVEESIILKSKIIGVVLY